MKNMEFYGDLESLQTALGGHLARDIGLGPWAFNEPEKKEGAPMAPEMTPRTWPCESRGFVEDASGLAGASTLFVRLARWLRDRFGPRGRVLASLSQGQTVALEGARMAKVECLAGMAWVTCSSDGRDIRLGAGNALAFSGKGMVAVTAMDGPARVRLGWR